MSSSGTFTDPRDGNTYRTVLLRDGKWWLAENLRYNAPGSFLADKNPPSDILATKPQYDWALLHNQLRRRGIW